MRIPRPPHPWRLTPARAAAWQARLACRVDLTPPPAPIRRVAGLDCAFSRDGRMCIAGAVVWDVLDRRVVEQQVARAPLRFPYVPGLLSFREAPALLAVLRRLRAAPDALMCDGQGLAHPRRFGLACHLGVLTGVPALGCAKSVLVGAWTEPDVRRGARSDLVDRGETVGAALRTRDGVKPVFVSPGHRFDQASAEALVLACAIRHRLPEPTRLADHLVSLTR